MWSVGQSYTEYDGVNRLKTASETNGWTQTFSYDVWGNRGLQGQTGLPQSPQSIGAGDYSGANNRVAGSAECTAQDIGQYNWCYDRSGNLTKNNVGETCSFDAENRQTAYYTGAPTQLCTGATAHTRYFYDGEGRRVKKERVIAGGVRTTVWVYDGGGRLAAEYTDEPMAAGEVVGTFYRTLDHLGTTRVVTNGTGGVHARLDLAPFGEEIPGSANGRSGQVGYSAAVPFSPRFTGKERDAETGLDYFGARYFSGAQGRFTSPDNFLNDTTALDPQRWNLYTYARNNPLRYVDPNGDKIYAGALSDEDQQELLKRINATYGCRGCTSVDKKGYLQVDTSGLSKQMLAATDYLTGAINSTSFFARVQVSNNDPGLAFGETRLGASSVEWNGNRVNASLIRLDFGDDRWIGGDSAARQTFLDTVFAHEVAHVFPTFLRDPTTAGPTGPVVDTVNRITDLHGEPRRTGYMSSPVGGHWLSLPFSKTTVDKNGQTKEKAVQIQWMRRNVGGRGVN